MRILVLAGTEEARELATELTLRGHEVVASFLGLTRGPDSPPFHVRVGGFGGVEGLTDALRDDRFDLLIDASHPFAVRMGKNARDASELTGVPLLRLVRPPWTRTEDDHWHEVSDLAEAAEHLERSSFERALLSVGRFGLLAFTGLSHVHLVVRTIQQEQSPTSNVTVVVGKAPFELDSEIELLKEHRIDVIVTRNSGGTATQAKLIAARRLGIPVVMIRRPTVDLEVRANDVEGALAWVEEKGR